MGGRGREWREGKRALKRGSKEATKSPIGAAASGMPQAAVGSEPMENKPLQ